MEWDGVGSVMCLLLVVVWKVVVASGGGAVD